MRMVGIEPTLCHHNWILSPARLPVPPHPHTFFTISLLLDYNTIPFLEMQAKFSKKQCFFVFFLKQAKEFSLVLILYFFKIHQNVLVLDNFRQKALL